MHAVSPVPQGSEESGLDSWAPARSLPDDHVQCGQANIKEPQYNVNWFKGFDLVLNGLDNLDARRHVNRLCLAAEVPLVESGTAAYLGQVRCYKRPPSGPAAPPSHTVMTCFQV